MKWLIVIVVLWPVSGAIAYFHRIYDDKKTYRISYPLFVRDGFFYNSLLNGFRAFYFEFL